MTTSIIHIPIEGGDTIKAALECSDIKVSEDGALFVNVQLKHVRFVKPVIHQEEQDE